jgi:RNA polymerase sigma-70 factor (ECF subfamily)
MPTSEIHDVYRTRFEETRWSVVLRAKQSDDDGLEALEKLCRTYRLPLYSFVRFRGFSRADAEDLVQDFFVTLIERNRLEKVEPHKGRFRSFLLASLKNFLANEWDARRALKRGGAFRFVSLQDPDLESLYERLAGRQEDPDRLFDRSWAVALVQKAMNQLSHEYDQEGRGAVFNALKSCLSPAGKEFSYREVGVQLRMPEDRLRTAVQRMRQRFKALLRTEIRHTLRSDEEVDDELKHLLSCL